MRFILFCLVFLGFGGAVLMSGISILDGMSPLAVGCSCHAAIRAIPSPLNGAPKKGTWIVPVHLRAAAA